MKQLKKTRRLMMELAGIISVLLFSIGCIFTIRGGYHFLFIFGERKGGIIELEKALSFLYMGSLLLWLGSTLALTTVGYRNNPDWNGFQVLALTLGSLIGNFLYCLFVHLLCKVTWSNHYEEAYPKLRNLLTYRL